MSTEAATAATRYVRWGRVSGWLTRSAASVLIDVAGQMAVANRPVCEIGVHHGKLAILLGMLTRGRVVGYDLFSMQEHNTDRSGRGNKESFLNNCNKYLGASADVSAIEVNSLTLTPDRVINDCGSAPVFFSVDGGHTAELTYNDLTIAADAVANDGVIILDDFYNEAWPEVAFGATSFLYERPNILHPFCIVGNKMLLTRNQDLADRLVKHLLGRPAAKYPSVYYIGECRLLNRRVCQMRVAGGARLMAGRLAYTPAWQDFRKTALGQAVLRACGR